MKQIIIIIIIISIFKEDNVFSITASLPYAPPVNTDIDYHQTFFGLLIFASVARLVVRNSSVKHFLSFQTDSHMQTTNLYCFPFCQYIEIISLL